MARAKLSFSESLSSVEETIRKIENNELELDELFSEVKKSTKTLNDCKTRIYKTEEDLKKFFDEMEM